MSVKLVSYTPNPERQIELAYLTCRNLDPWNPIKDKTLEERIDAIWKSGHFSVFEFADATFYISGVSRNLSHQFVRHRMASYCQLSMRSVNVKDLPIITPPTMKDAPITGDREFIVGSVRDVYRAYELLVKQGIPMEDARYLLPNGIETRFMVKMNFRSWIHFLRLRMEKHAQWEIRDIAEQIHLELFGIAPRVFNTLYQPLWERV